MTMWKAENVDWALTRSEKPMCFKCSTTKAKPGEPVKPVRMEFTDTQKTTCRCSGCGKTFYREVA